MSSEIPKFLRAKDLVLAGTFPVSENVLLQAARRHGIGRKIGRTIIFSPSDINLLYEALPS